MSNEGSAPLLIYSQREANRWPPQSKVIMIFFLHAARTRQVGQLPRQHGEAETPTSHQLPHINRGRRLLGPVALRTIPLASPQSQVRVRLGPGGDFRRPGNEGTQTCLPTAHGVALPVARYGPSSSATTQDPREGPSLARRTTPRPPKGGLARLAPEEQRYLCKVHLARFISLQKKRHIRDILGRTNFFLRLMCTTTTVM